jgi:hypothetical protein
MCIAACFYAGFVDSFIKEKKALNNRATYGWAVPIIYDLPARGITGRDPKAHGISMGKPARLEVGIGPKITGRILPRCRN